ncbi:MAG: hypothetical protein ACE5IK_03690 [Acidobacteriota bacterium]
MSGFSQSAVGIGFLLGLRHAFDADHLVAVSTLVSRESRLRRAVSIGLLWAAGHTATVTAASLVLVAMHRSVNGRLAATFEFLVAILIIWLGFRLVLAARHGVVHSHRHVHGARTHRHIHLHSRRHGHGHGHPHHPEPPRGRTPMIALSVGMIHGLAGSGTLTVLLAAAAHTPTDSLVFLVLFGAGSAVGMVATTLTMSIPVGWTLSGSAGTARAVQMALGVISIGFGVWMAGHTL